MAPGPATCGRCFTVLCLSPIRMTGAHSPFADPALACMFALVCYEIWRGQFCAVVMLSSDIGIALSNHQSISNLSFMYSAEYAASLIGTTKYIVYSRKLAHCWRQQKLAKHVNLVACSRSWKLDADSPCRVMLFSDLEHLADFAAQQFGPSGVLQGGSASAGAQLLQHLTSGLGGEYQRCTVNCLSAIWCLAATGCAHSFAASAWLFG